MLLASVLAALGGCGSTPQGIYQSASGTLSVEFKSGKAYLTMPPATAREVPYQFPGDRVTLNVEGQKLIFTRKKDDSLEAPTPIGVLSRKKGQRGFLYTGK